MLPKVSIIVPVYNCERYLRTCVDSIIKQTLTDFELILIDDGSTDNSGMICDNYASCDRRIRVIHKNNGGVSSARNVGLDSSTGEYVLFCDSDDWLSPDTLDKGIRICETGIDICAFGYIRVNGDEHKRICIDNPIQCSSEDLSEKEIVDLISFNYLTAPWAKIISRALIADKRFDVSLTFGEDMVFILSLFKEKCYFYAAADTGYYYRENESGITSNISISKCNSAVKAYRFLNDFADSRTNSGIILREYVRKRWADDFFGMMHQIYTSDIKIKEKYIMIKVLTGDRFLLDISKDVLTKSEKYECMVLCFKSLLPGLSSFLNRYVKRPGVFNKN